MVSSPRVVGVCGTGMMGGAIGRRLAEGGVDVIAFDPSGRPEARDRIRALGLREVASVDQFVAQADVVLSVMGSQAAPVFADQLIRAVQDTPREGLVFAECNLVDIETVRQIDRRMTQLGVRVVDAGICGAPPSPGHAPAVFVAGPHLGDLDFLRGHGFEVWEVGDRIGDATALKNLSAAGWQGCVALLSEVLVAAHRYGLASWLARDLESHLGSLYAWFAPALAEAVPRSGRWAPDMGVIARTLESVGASPAYHLAASEVYRAMATLSDTEHDGDLASIAAALDASSAQPDPERADAARERS